MDARSNPGAATPELLHRMYKDRASVTANPYTLRAIQSHIGVAPSSTPVQNVHSTIGVALTSTPSAAIPNSLRHGHCNQPSAPHAQANTQKQRIQTSTAVRMENEALLKHRALVAPSVQPTGLRERRSGDSPPRGRFVCVSAPPTQRTAPSHTDIGLTLNSISFKR